MSSDNANNTPVAPATPIETRPCIGSTNVYTMTGTQLCESISVLRQKLLELDADTHADPYLRCKIEDELDELEAENQLRIYELEAECRELEAECQRLRCKLEAECRELEAERQRLNKLNG